MKINSINNVNYFNKNTNLKPNFNGLWSKTSVDTDIDQSMNIPVIKRTCYYHPFEDETPEQISKIQESVSDADMDPECTKYIITECRVCSRTPFTSAEYDKYKSISKGPIIGSKMREIDCYVADKYSNCMPSENQKQARNLNIVS